MPLISLAIRMFEQQNNLISQLARTLPPSFTLSVPPPLSTPPPQSRNSDTTLTPRCAPLLFFFPFTPPPPPHFFSPARCQPFLHSLTVGIKGGFLGRLGNGILWALSENLQIKRAGLMESNGGRERWDVGKRLRLLAASQKTSKISLFVN